MDGSEIPSVSGEHESQMARKTLTKQSTESGRRHITRGNKWRCRTALQSPGLISERVWCSFLELDLVCSLMLPSKRVNVEARGISGKHTELTTSLWCSTNYLNGLECWVFVATSVDLAMMRVKCVRNRSFGDEGFYIYLQISVTVEVTKVSSSPISYYQSVTPATIGTSR